MAGCPAGPWPGRPDGRGRAAAAAAADQAGGPGGGPPRRAGAAGPGAPGLSGPGPGAPPSGPGAGRRGTLGASRRSARQENEDLTAASGAGLARDAGPDAAAAFGADPGGWAPADGFEPPGGPAATSQRPCPAPRPAATSGGRTTAPRCSVTVRSRPGRRRATAGRGAGPPDPGRGAGVARLAGGRNGAAGPGAAAGDGRDADRGGRKRWRLGRKAAGQHPPVPDAPERTP